MTTTTERTTTVASTEQFFPGLEGLRGLAVVAVLFFHGGFSWAKGGFLGVSTFFTLSGFLITTNVLRQVQTSGGLSLGEFWKRRFRRLLPAALAAILLASIYTALAGDPSQRNSFGGDSISSLAYVANWHFIFSGQTYAALFSAPSALLHFWSLAIEEQFYLIFPLISLVVFAKLKMGRRSFGLVLAGLLVASLACTFLLGLSNNAIYLGTETRAGEILIGALFAVFMTAPRTRRLTTDRNTLGAGVAVLGVVGLLLAIGAYITVDQTDSWLYNGGLTAFGLVSLLLISAAIAPVGPVRSILSSRPLRRIGLISYGVYLYHWPIFLWLSPANTGWSDAALFVPRVAISIGLAVLSFRFLEQPIKSGRRFLDLPPRLTIAVSTVGLAALAVLISSMAPIAALDFASKDKLAAELNAQAALSTASGTPHQAIFGDSSAIMLNYGVGDVYRETKEALPLGGPAKQGCGLVRGFEVIHLNEAPRLMKEECEWGKVWPEYLDENRVDIATIMFGPWDARPHRIPGTSTWLTPGDQKYDAAFTKEFLAASDLLASKGAAAIWLTSIPVGTLNDKTKTDFSEQAEHPEWQTHLNELMIKAAAERPNTVRVVDLAKWYASAPRDDAANRPDGTHFEESAAARIGREWLNRAILDAYQSLKKQAVTSSTTAAKGGR
jgi:peptidoglycan/LPS O-acetylase OafA/YrhL